MPHENERAENALNSVYVDAESLEGDYKKLGLTESQLDRVETISKYATAQKGAVSVLVTLLTKKIITPSQDVRQHRADLDNGFSGRTLDTKIITPFMLKKFGIHFAMAESGWLSRTLEQSEAYTLSYKGKISSTVKMPFLNILNDIELLGVDPEAYLKILLAKLILQKKDYDQTITNTISKKIEGVVTISGIMMILKEFFNSSSSRSPVIAVKTILDLLLDEIIKYKGKKIPALEAHTTSDRKSGSSGDILIKDNGATFESFEIKHNIQIDSRIILNVKDKLEKTPVPKYFILTTSTPTINPDDAEAVQETINEIYQQFGCDVIISNLQEFISSNLIILQNPIDFLNLFGKNLAEDSKLHGSFTKKQLVLWQNIIEDIIKKFEK